MHFSPSWLIHCSPVWFRAATRWAVSLAILMLPAIAWAANVSGRVTSVVDGHPLAGATVQASNGLSATADSNGYYTIYSVDSGTYTVTATFPGFFSRAASVMVGTTVTSQDFQLATGGQIQGTVYGASGAAVAGATVNLSGGLVPTNKTLVADAWGNFSSNWIPVGNYNVTATVNGSGSPAQAVSVNTGAVSRVTLSMSSAQTVNAIQNMTGWQSCTATWPNGTPCAAGWGTAGYSLAQFQSSPSLSGSSAQFSLWGSTPYSNALWWKQLAAAPSATHFDYSFWVYVTDGTKPQSLEFDVNQTVNSTKFIFGTECDFKDKHRWQVWDGLTGHWVPTNLNCVAFQSSSWNHFVWHFERTADMVHYISLTINNVTYPVDVWTHPQANVNVQELNVAVQLDGDYAQQPYSLWVDNLSITYW
jgi:hypothetical protein